MLACSPPEALLLPLPLPFPFPVGVPVGRREVEDEVPDKEATDGEP